jgi:hypothetical protein
LRTDRVFAWIAGLLFAALAPAAAFAGFARSVQVLPIAFMVTLGHAVALGLPAALLFRYEQWTSLIGAIAAGLLIGAIPVGILEWPLQPGSGFSASSPSGPTVVDGIPTWAGWLEYLQLVGGFGLLGALGALAFWLTLKVSGVLILDGTPPFSRLSVALAAIAVLASAAVGIAPELQAAWRGKIHFHDRDGKVVAEPPALDLK